MTSHSPGTKVLVKVQFPKTATGRCLVYTLGRGMNPEILGNSENPAHGLKSTTLAYKNDRRLDLRCHWGAVNKRQGVSEHSSILKSPLNSRGTERGGERERTGEGSWLNSMGKP